MNLETLKIANGLKAAIEDRIKYGEELKHHIDCTEDPNKFELFGRFINYSSTKLRDIDPLDLMETALARNEKEIKKLEKQFENLK
jgi:hypothetical protein